jgi:glutamine amidotransferase
VKNVVVLDYGSGNLRSVQRAVERVGATVEVTADRDTVLAADGLVVPGVGAYAACMAGIEAIDGRSLVTDFLATGRPVLGICVGMQVFFELGVEHGELTHGLGLLDGTVEQLKAPILPHMGWNTVCVPSGSSLFEGVADERFYFVHSYAARNWELDPIGALARPTVTWAVHGEPFVAAAENGPLSATQFHPEKSGEPGIRLLGNWLRSL